MAQVIKNVGKTVEVWKLGAGSEMERKLIEEGKIVYLLPDEKRKTETGKIAKFEIFFQEAKSGTGQLAGEGDYFKVDNSGKPYPQDEEWFFDNHRHIEGDTWEQLPKALLAWESTEEITPEVQFLIDEKGLKLDVDNPEKYFGAELWGAWLTAASDAVLIFYSVSYEDGKVVDADFNFVARAEFEATYHYC